MKLHRSLYARPEVVQDSTAPKVLDPASGRRALRSMLGSSRCLEETRARLDFDKARWSERPFEVLQYG
jgi:hypothetical protein